MMKNSCKTLLRPQLCTLSRKIGVKAIEAAAEAAAAAQTTTVIRDSGAISGNVSGDSGAFVLGKTLSGGSNEIAQMAHARHKVSMRYLYRQVPSLPFMSTANLLLILTLRGGNSVMQAQLPSLLAIVLISLAGCAGSKDTILPADGPSMKTIVDIGTGFAQKH